MIPALSKLPGGIMRCLSLRSLSLLALITTVACGGGNRSGFLGLGDEEEEPSDTKDTQSGELPPSGSFGENSGGLELDPKNTTVIIDTATNPSTPGSVSYKVKAAGQDVTSAAKFTVEDGALGSFNGATFTTTGKLPGTAIGVSTLVQASTKEGIAAGRVTIVQLRKTGDQRDFFFIVPHMKEPS